MRSQELLQQCDESLVPARLGLDRGEEVGDLCEGVACAEDALGRLFIPEVVEGRHLSAWGLFGVC